MAHEIGADQHAFDVWPAPSLIAAQKQTSPVWPLGDINFRGQSSSQKGHSRVSTPTSTKKMAASLRVVVRAGTLIYADEIALERLT
jgi:hypothetical protein